MRLIALLMLVQEAGASSENQAIPIADAFLHVQSRSLTSEAHEQLVSTVHTAAYAANDGRQLLSVTTDASQITFVRVHHRGIMYMMVKMVR